MAGAAIRWLQMGLLFTAFIFSIIVCCSAPVSRDVAFLVKGNAKQATNPNEGFAGLRLGMTGYCNKGRCAQYREYTDERDKTLEKTKPNNYERAAIQEVAGTKAGGDLTKKKWLQLAILFGASVATTFFTLVLIFLTAKGSSMPPAGMDPYGGGMASGDAPILKLSRYAFRGFAVLSFILLLTAWSITHIEFTKAKDTLMKQGGVDASFGMAWYLSLVAFILTALAAMLEGAAMASARKTNYEGGGAAGGYPGGGGGDFYQG